MDEEGHGELLICWLIWRGSSHIGAVKEMNESDVGLIARRLFSSSVLFCSIVTLALPLV